jgi:hypothetical protein
MIQRRFGLCIRRSRRQPEESFNSQHTGGRVILFDLLSEMMVRRRFVRRTVLSQSDYFQKRFRRRIIVYLFVEDQVCDLQPDFRW